MHTKLKTFIILITLGLTLLISCEKEIEFKGEVTQPLLVLNSIINPDSVVTVHLSQSRFVLGKVGSIPNITDAYVTLYVNGLDKGLLIHRGEGIYKGDYKPKPLDEIRIAVEAPGFEKLEAETVVPEAVNLEIVSMTNEDKVIPSQEGIYDQHISNLNIKSLLKDNGEKENFYYVKGRMMIFHNNQLSYITPLDINLSDIIDNDKVIGNKDVVSGSIWGEEEDNENTKNIFTDTFINGKELGLNFSFTEPLVIGEEGDKMKYDVVYEIEVAQMTKDLYLYILSSDMAVRNEGIPIIEATQVHSNVSNKVGILGAYNSYKISKAIHLNR